MANRSFGGAQVSRTFYARGQTGQQLLLGAYQALARQVGLGTVNLAVRTELMDIVIKDGRAVGVVVRDLLTGEISSHSAHAVVLATGGYSNVYYLSTNAMTANVTAAWRAHRRGAAFANPCFTQIHPTCIPPSEEFQSKLTLMSESLRNDGRVWVPRSPDDNRPPDEIPDADRDYYLERIYPLSENLVPRDVASRAAKRVVDANLGVGVKKNGVYLDFRDAIARLGRQAITDRYGNLIEMYNRITDEDPYRSPMRIYPAPHYTMGGLWVDYNLMTTIPGLYALGEANFSDHGANRLGASALMQGLADGYFVLPYTIGDYLADFLNEDPASPSDEVFARAESELADRMARLLSMKGNRTVDDFHRRLGRVVWGKCGMARSRQGLDQAMSELPDLYEEFRTSARVPGDGESLNQSLEKAARLEDFFELAIAMCIDARQREESCGGHFREEHQNSQGDAVRDDENFSTVSAWMWTGDPTRPELIEEPLSFENVQLSTRSYQ